MLLFLPYHLVKITEVYSRTYKTNSDSPHKISRSKIDLFIECPRCFYLDQKLGIKRPSFPAFSLNSAVDALLKKEFDLLRKKGQIHQLLKKYHVNAVPFDHPEIDTWRNNFVGKQYHHTPTNLIVFGAIDDIWINPKKELIIVDYKSTSTDKEISLEDKYKQGYKRQMEIYQWIFHQGGFKVAKTGYFVYANAIKNKPSFDGKLEFEMSLIAYSGSFKWVDKTLFDIKKLLDQDKVPNYSSDCEHCQFALKAKGK